MKNLFLFLCLAAGGLLWSAPRVAVFDEPGFPNASKRDAAFYSRVLNGRILNLKDLGKLKSFDVLIFPHGGYVPADAESAVYHFMRRGKTVIICGDLQEPPTRPAKAPRARNAELLAFEEKYGLSHGGPLSCVNGRWIVAPSGAVYESNNAPRWYDFFALFGWPNYAQSYAPNYMRPFDKPVYLNKAFQKSGLAAKIEPEKKGMMLARLRPMCETGDHALDVFHPLYQFATPSGRPYRPFLMAGKSAEDRAADGFIFRKYRPDMFGATLVVMGKTGRILLDSEKGEETIRSIVKLSGSSLPGEFPARYIKKVHALEKRMQDYNLVNADLTAALKRLAVKNHPSGKYHPQLVRLKTLRSEFTRFNNRFDGLMLLKENRKEIPSAVLDELSADLAKSIVRLQTELVPLKKYVLPSDGGPAVHPYQKFTVMTSKFGPWHVDDAANWKKVKELGVTVSAIGAVNWKDMEKLNARYGFVSTYTAIPMHRSHPDKKRVESGVFNPASGTVKKVKARVWGKEAPDIDSAVIRNLRWAEKSRGIGVILHGDERDFQWSLWGKYMEGMFRRYLAEKYKTVSVLNREYNARYSSFDEIMLPLKRPETQTEHALWEDWTRYREIYRQEYELERWVKLIKKHAPSKRQWLYGSYHLQNKHPANGINYYETGKWLDPATFESSSNPRKEVMTYDIAAFGKKHVNPEWAGFYFPAGSRIANSNRMREFFWNEANCGTISWHTFMGGVQSRSRWTHTPLITPNGNIQPEGIALRDTVRELNAARKLFLDGKRAEPEVRFVYSPTTRRHTSWPGIEEDRSYQCVTGLNEAFKALHIPARGIDEQAVWEGKLSAACRFLLVPSVEYMNRKLLAALKKFMEEGGTVIATADAGRFDEYGHKKEALLEMAGVRSQKTVDEDFPMFVPDKLEVLFPQETKVLLRYADGAAAATATPVGKGRLVICGYPIGREFNNSGKGLASLQKLTGVLGIARPFVCNDPNLVIRPWTLDGKLYLACYYIHRDTVPVAKGDFPLRSAPVMIPFAIDIAGAVSAVDCLTGTVLKSEKRGNSTLVSGLIGNPGGCLIRLSAGTLPRRVIKNVRRVSGKAVAAQKSFTLPASGKFFAEWGSIKLGRYTLTLSAENDGAWAGKVFASLSFGGRTLKRECVPGSSVIFRFAENTVIFRCQKAQSFMPVNVEGVFREVKNKSLSGCRIDNSEGRIILQNSLLYAVILPGFGGRIGELRASSDSANQFLLNEKVLAEGLGKSYRDFGGIEYNPGIYQGAGWQIPFDFTVVKKSKKEIVLRLNRSGKYPLPRGGAVSYEIFYRITAGSPFLETRVRLYNEMPQEASLVLRTHPLFLAGGSCGAEDVFCWNSPEGASRISYRPGYNQYFPNKGNYLAWIDRTAGEGLLQTFSASEIPQVYLWTGKVSYNSELHFKPVKTAAGKYAEFSFFTAPVTGLSGVDGVSKNFVVQLDTAALKGKIFPLVSSRGDCRLILEQNGKILAEKVVKAVRLTPGKVVEAALEQPLSEGDYKLILQCGKERFERTFSVQSKKSSAAAGELEKLKKEYQKAPTRSLRQKIFRLSGL